MTERDHEKNPYTQDERRVCEYLLHLTNNTVGCGDDPIAFLMASHSGLLSERRYLKTLLRRAPTHLNIQEIHEAVECEIRRQHKDGVEPLDTKMLAEAIALAYATKTLDETDAKGPEVVTAINIIGEILDGHIQDKPEEVDGLATSRDKSGAEVPAKASDPAPAVV